MNASFAYLYTMNNAQHNTMTTAAVTLDRIAEEFGSKVWNDTRVYLNQYKGGKNSKTTVYVYRAEDGTLDVSVYVEARTAGARSYAMNRKAEIRQEVLAQLNEIAEEVADEAAAQAAVEEVVAEVVEAPAVKLNGSVDNANKAAAFKSWAPAQRRVIEEMQANDGIALMTATQMNEFDGDARVDDGHVYEVTISMNRNKRSVQLIALQRAEGGDADTCNDEVTPGTRFEVACRYHKWVAEFHGAEPTADHLPIPSLASAHEMSELMEVYG